MFQSNFTFTHQGGRGGGGGRRGKVWDGETMFSPGCKAAILRGGQRILAIIPIFFPKQTF